MADFVGPSIGIVQIEIPDLGKIEADLSPAAFGQGMHVGFAKVGNLIAREAKNIIRPHHFTGRYEQQITTTTTGEGLNVQTRVGVLVPKVPEARPLEYGWKSESGKQPPIDAIARWLARKPDIGSSVSSNIYRNSQGFRRTRGTISDVSRETAVRGLAFVIARKIKERGYSFPPLHAWERAWAIVRPQAGTIIRRSLLWRGKTAGD